MFKSSALAATVAASLLAISAAAHAAECDNPDALGVSRVLEIDPTTQPKIGTMSYHDSLPLNDHEIVITFDDGPLPPHTEKILETLAAQCVKATYFMVGRMAHGVGLAGPAHPHTVASAQHRSERGHETARTDPPARAAVALLQSNREPVGHDDEPGGTGPSS